MSQQSQIKIPKNAGNNSILKVGKIDIFGLYEIASNSPMDRNMIKKYQGSNCVLKAWGMNLKNRKVLGDKIKSF